MSNRPSLTPLLLCCLGFALSSGCSSKTPSSEGPPAPKVPELHEIVLNGPLPEELHGELFGGSRHNHRELLDELDNVVKQPLIKGVFLRVAGFSGAWARAAEVTSSLQRVRAAGKPVHCHFDNVDNAGYALLAASCDKLSMGPAGMLGLTGVHAETVYAKDLLDLVGLEAELLQVGRFKGAADALTRSSMPDEVRQVLDLLVDDLQHVLTDALTKGRKLDEAQSKSAIDSGPHAANSALELKLVDAITFDDEARAHALEAARVSHSVRALRDDENEHLEFGELLSALFGGKPEKPKGERISLAYLSGTISDDPHDRPSGSASGPFVAAMRRIADERDIRALVLRIDSPGGSALASDKMWHAVARVAKRKPVIVSVGDMAASGGYYVASAGTEIFAQAQSLLGSIGVVGGKIVGASLAARLGVHSTALSRGQNSGWMSPFHPFSKTERAAILRAMRQTYDTFIVRVRDGRHLDPARLSAVAEGRVMSGHRAHEGGLVDTIGGLNDALARARSQAGLRPDANVEVWPKERSVFERASKLFAGSESRHVHALNQLAEALPELSHSPILSAWLHGDLAPLAALPYVLRLE